MNPQITQIPQITQHKKTNRHQTQSFSIRQFRLNQDET
jgi:hypothetical protein